MFADSNQERSSASHEQLHEVASMAHKILAHPRNPEELVGREVEFKYQPYHKLAQTVRGTVVGVAKTPGAVIIRPGPGALCNRPVSEIEVVA